MRRFLMALGALAASLGLWAAPPARAQDDQAACLAEMQRVVRPLLEQAQQFSPAGVRGYGFAPLAQPFAPPAYAAPFGPYPAPPWVPAPTAAYNVSAGFTGLAGLPAPGQLTSQAISQFLLAGGQLNLTNPAAANPQLLIALASLQQTEQARLQQQALLQQQQGLYLNSLYQLSASYQETALDWAEAYATLAQAWLSYYRDLCGLRRPVLGL
jgi:hypothetical protein